MPKALLDFMGYKFYFWSNENDEPIHVHVSKGKQVENATKFWITREGVELVHNNSNIPQNDLKRIYRYICSNKEDIVFAWYQHFGLMK